MKKLTFLVAVLALMAFTTSVQESKNELSWKDWNTGFAQAKKENKIALIDVYTEWCGWCKRMDKTTYESEKVVSLIKEKFIPIKFNPELKQKYFIEGDTLSGPQLLGALSQGRHSGFPTTYFFLPEKKIMFQFAGYMDENKFLDILNEMVAKANQ